MTGTIRSLATALGLGATLVACQGSELERPLDQLDVVTDTTDDTSNDTTDAVESSLRWWFVTDDGTKCVDEATCELVREDEPAAYVDVPGFQIEVQVEMVGVNAGTDVILMIDGDTVAQGVSTFGGGGTTGVRFTNVTIPADGEVTVTVSSTDADGASLSESKVVTTSFAPCALTVTAALDADTSCAKLTIGEAGGLQIPVIVHHPGGVCESATLSYTFDDNTTELDAVPFDDKGDAAFVIAFDADAALEGDLTVVAKAVHPTVENLSGEVEATWTVDNVAPALSITSPAAGGSVGPSDDVDPDTDGLQYDVGGDIDDDAASLELRIDGDAVGEASESDPGTFTFAGVTLGNDGVTEFRVTATDACGNEGEAVVSVPVIVNPAQVEITDPADGATLLAVDDRDPDTASSYELDITVSAPTAGDGDSIVVECGTAATPPTFTEVGAAAVDADTIAADGLYAIAVTLDVGAFGNDIMCRARVDSASNPGVSEAIGLTVALPAPTLGVITAPLAEACLTGDSWDVAGTATGLDGADVTISVSVGASESLSATGGPVDSDAYDVAVDVSSLDDGAYDVSVDATDAWGNVVSETQAAPSVSVVRDTTVPVISLTSPNGTINPNASPDEDGAAAGYQTTVTLKLDDVHAAGGELCLSVGGADMGCETIAAGSDSASWSGVTLVPGDNALSATGSDLCGLAAEALTATVTLSAEAPTVAITDPAEDTLTAADTATIVATVTASDGATPVTGAAVTLTNGGTDTGVSASDNGDGTYIFADVALSAGDNTFTVAATVATGSATSEPRIITRKTVTPTIALTAPTVGTFNIASSECQGGGLSCVLDAFATTTAAEDGSAAQLAVDCDGDVTTYDATVSAGAVTFSGVTLAQGTCTLAPSVTDLADQSATGDDVVVVVDRVAPTLQITSPIANQLVFNQDTDPATPGIQHALTVVATGVEAGQVITATLAYTDPANATSTITLTHTVATDTADAETYVASFEDSAGAGTVSFFDGSYDITITVADAAENPAIPATKTVQIQSEEAYVRVTFPTYVAPVACDASTPCASGSVCNLDAGLCYDAWQIDEAHNIVTTTAGVLTASDNLRICSNHPSLAGTGAATCATDLGDGTTFYELVLTDTTGGPNATDIGSLVPEGFQTIVAEILPLSGGLWQSSEASGNAVNERDRLLYVDLSRPTVSSLGSPSDSLAPPGILNAAEQSAEGRVFDIGFTASEAGSATVYINGSAAGTTDVSAGATVVQAPLASGANTIYVVLTDAVGNASIAPPTPGAPIYTPTVDVVGPTLSFVTPTSSPLRAGDNLDVTLSSDAEGGTVTLLDGGTTVGTALVTSGNASFPDAAFGTLSDGTHSLTASVSDDAGNITTATTTPEEIAVDTVDPSGTIDSPLTGTTFTDADDADAGTAGFQLAVDLSTADGAVSWSLWTASNCDLTFSSCDAPVVKKSGAVTNPGGAEPQQQVTIDLSAATTYKRLILDVVDDVGNTASTSVDLTFIVANCALVFDDLPATDWYNAAACADGTSCATANVTISVSQVGACVGITEVQLLDGATVLGTDSSPGSSSTFAVTLSDGAELALEAKALTGANEAGSTGVRDMRTDFTPPDVSFVTATIDGFTTPAEGDALVWNTELDHAPLTAGFQFHARVQVGDAHADGGSILTVEATGSDGPTALTPSNVTLPAATTGTSPVSRDLLDMTLSDLDTHVVTVSAVDAAGNPGSSSFTAQVDVTRPDPVVINNVGVISKRRVRSIIQFTAVGDNGMAGGAVARYDMRYSRNPISDENFDSACDFRDLYITQLVPVPAAPGSAQSGQVGAPDKRPFSDACKLMMTFDDGVSAASDPLWYYAVRAEDAAGNVSLLGPTSVAIQNRGQMQLDVDRIVFSDDAGSAFAGTATLFPIRGGAIGDVNNDGVMDLGTGGEIHNAFCVLYGHSPAAEEILTTASGTNHDCNLDPSAIFSGETARSTAAAIKPLGDVNGDDIDDFGVTGRFAAGDPTGEGFALIYLGRDGGPDLATPDVVIRGLQHVGGVNGAANIALCGAGDFDGLDDGGGLADDIGVGEPAYNRFHVIPGRTSWTPGQARVTIDLLFDADLDPTNGEPDDSGVRADNGVFSVYGPTFAVTTGLFGTQCGAAGDLLPTPAGGGSGDKGDVVVWQSGSDDARLFVIPGREYTAGSIVNVSQNVTGPQTDPGYPTAEDSISLRLRQEASGVKAGFGAAMLTNVDVTGDFVPDIVAGCRARSSERGGDGKSVYVFDGAKLALLVGTDVRVDIGANPKTELSWRGANGYVVDESVSAEPGSIGDVGNLDELYLGSPPVPGNDLMIGNSENDHVTLRVEHRVPGVIDYGQFPVRDAQLSDIFGVTGFAVIGTWIGGGFDLDGDSKLDFATGGGGGQILIVH